MKGSSKDKDICIKIKNFINENKLEIKRNGKPPQTKQKIEPEILEIIKKIQIDEEKEILKKFVESQSQDKKYKSPKAKWQRKKDQIKHLPTIKEESEGLQNPSYENLLTKKTNPTR